MKAVNDALAPILSSPDIIKAGRMLPQDLYRFHKSYPELECVKSVPSCIETSIVYRLGVRCIIPFLYIHVHEAARYVLWGAWRHVRSKRRLGSCSLVAAGLAVHFALPLHCAVTGVCSSFSVLVMLCRRSSCPEVTPCASVTCQACVTL